MRSERLVLEPIKRARGELTTFLKGREVKLRLNTNGMISAKQGKETTVCNNVIIREVEMEASEIQKSPTVSENVNSISNKMNLTC